MQLKTSFLAMLATILIGLAMSGAPASATGPIGATECVGTVEEMTVNGETFLGLACSVPPSCCGWVSRSIGAGVREAFCTCSTSGAEPYCCHTVLIYYPDDLGGNFGDASGFCGLPLCDGSVNWVCSYSTETAQASCVSP